MSDLTSQERGRPLVIGHRGARADYPENTLTGFLHAIECGADALEVDVAVTRDNVLVASHDLIVKARVCRGSESARTIRQLTWEQVRRWDCGRTLRARFPRQRPLPGASMPSLDEVLRLDPDNRVQFYIELKTDPGRPDLTPPAEEHAELVVEALRRCGVEQRSVVMSFDVPVLWALRRVAPDVRRARLFSLRFRSFGRLAAHAKCDIVAPQASLVTRRKADNAHRAGLPVVAWTANRPAQWRRLVQAGVDGIVTDDPAGLRRFLAEL